MARKKETRINKETGNKEVRLEGDTFWSVL